VKHTISFDDSLWDVVVATSGQANLGGFRAFIEELLTSPRFRPGMNILADHTNLDAQPLTSEHMRALSGIVIDFDERIGPGLCATVVPSPHKFRLAQTWQKLVQDHVLMRTGIFYSREFADGWLRSAQSPA